MMELDKPQHLKCEGTEILTFTSGDVPVDADTMYLTGNFVVPWDKIGQFHKLMDELNTPKTRRKRPHGKNRQDQGRY